MIKKKYLKEIIKTINQMHPNKNTKFFIFGSSVTRKYFGDLDIGVVGNVKREDIFRLKEEFSKSRLPYFVDVINFNTATKTFKKNVFKNKIVWIKP